MWATPQPLSLWPSYQITSLSQWVESYNHYQCIIFVLSKPTPSVILLSSNVTPLSGAQCCGWQHISSFKLSITTFHLSRVKISSNSAHRQLCLGPCKEVIDTVGETDSSHPFQLYNLKRWSHASPHYGKQAVKIHLKRLCTSTAVS